MRILHTCLRYPPASGGAETYVHELVERTRRDQTLDVRVLTSSMRTHGPITELQPELLRADPPYVQRLHHAATPGIAYPRLQALSYYLGHHQPDIIHGYSFWYQPADVAARYAKKHNVPFIFHPLYYENTTRQKLLWQLYKKNIGAATFKAADVVVVISPFEQQLIEKAGFSVRRFALIPPGIDTEQFKALRPNPFTARGIHGQVLLTVSRLSPGKGLDDAITALPAIRKDASAAQLVIVGADFGVKKILREQARRNGVAEHVHFLGQLKEEELIGAYQHADIFVHPSHYEAFGIVLAESLAAGTPVVARNVAAIPYVVPDQKAGLLFNTNSELAAHIITLLNNPKQRDSMTQFGQKYVLNNFTWEQSIKKITDLYEELGSS